MHSHTSHVPEGVVVAALPDQVLWGVLQEDPVGGVPALVVGHGQVEVHDRPPGEQADVGRELRNAQLVEAAALLQAVD